MGSIWFDKALSEYVIKMIINKIGTYKIILELKNNERNDIIVVLGGVIPKKDYKNLLNGGVSAIFGPGSNINETAITILKILIKNLKL